MTNSVSNLLMDSGAFSAFTQGLSLTLDGYMKFLSDNKWITMYIALDDINSMRKSYDNYLIMLKNGFNPIPVYHLHDSGDEEFLKKYMDKTDFIGLGAIAEASTVIRAQALDSVFRRYLAPKGDPVIKVHGLGATSSDLILRFPWYSVDSTTWTKNAAGGRVWLPRYIDGKAKFRGLGDLITVSTRRGEHIDPNGEYAQRAWRYCKEKKLDFSVGKSKLVDVPPGYTLADTNEYWVRPNTMGGTGIIERIIERGVTNTMEYRAIVNVCYQFDFIETEYKNEKRFLERKGLLSESIDKVFLNRPPLKDFKKPYFYFGGIVSKGLKFVKFVKDNMDWIKVLESYALCSGTGLERVRKFAMREN
jgi:hypothetical protein